MGNFRSDLEDDMVKNHLNPDEFGEWVGYIPKGSAGEVRIQGVYDELPQAENIGAEVEVISHRPRLICRASDLPVGSPAKGDKVVLSANEWHKAATLRVVDFASDKLGAVEVYLQGPAQ